MLPPHNRMRNRLDFAETVRSGRRAGRRDIVVHLLQGGAGTRRAAIAQPRASRAGLVVGKQVGAAVARKQVSRRLRAALREVFPMLPPSSRLVVRALPSSAKADVPALEGQLRSALGKLLDDTPEKKGPS